MKKKKIYMRPTTERVGVKSQAALLAASQGRWADAKPNNPDFGNIWSDDDPTDPENEDTNWAGYKKNMSLW